MFSRLVLTSLVYVSEEGGILTFLQDGQEVCCIRVRVS